MSVYIVDYENVTIHGLEGVRNLTDEDTVCIFYGPVPAGLPFSIYLELMNTKARVYHIGTKKTAKNYLDFHAATYVGMLAGKGETGPFRLITKDAGFDSVVDFLTKEGFEVSRHETIQEAYDENEEEHGTEEHGINKSVPDDENKLFIPTCSSMLPKVYKEKVALALKTYSLTEKQVKKIAKCFEEAQSHTDLHNRIADYLRATGKFDTSTQSGQIYRRLRELYEDYHGLAHVETDLRKYEPTTLDKFKEQARHGLSALRTPLSKYHGIYCIAQNAKNKTEFRHQLYEKFGAETGEKYYLLLFDDFMHYLAGQKKEIDAEKSEINYKENIYDKQETHEEERGEIISCAL